MKYCKKYFEYFETFIGDGVVGIDSRCFETGFVNIYKIEE